MNPGLPLFTQIHCPEFEHGLQSGERVLDYPPLLFASATFCCSRRAPTLRKSKTGEEEEEEEEKWRCVFAMQTS